MKVRWSKYLLVFFGFTMLIDHYSCTINFRYTGESEVTCKIINLR